MHWETAQSTAHHDSPEAWSPNGPPRAEPCAASEEVADAPLFVDVETIQAPVPRPPRRWMTPLVISTAIHSLLVLIAVNVTLALQSSDPEPEPMFVLSAPSAELASGDAASSLESLASQEPGPAPMEGLAPLSRRAAPPVPAPAAPSLVSAPRPPAPPVQDVGSLTHSPREGGAPVSFSGLTTARARSATFVIDASGSMIGAFPAVLDELERTLAALNADQRFRVLFFQRNGFVEAPVAGLRAATPARKAEVLAWARRDVIPTGRSSPLSALEAALRDRPDVIFLLGTPVTGSGVYEISGADLRARLEELNPRDGRSGHRGVQIQCIQMLETDDDETLKAIAADHGGPSAFRFLSREDLGLAAP